MKDAPEEFNTTFVNKFWDIVEKGDSKNIPRGVSRRDYFAAMAMQGLLMARIVSGSNMRLAVEAADVLIAELDKKDKSE